MINIIDIEEGNIAITLSGGADSSIVYYAICEKYKNNPNVNIIPCTSISTVRDWYFHFARNIILIVGELTNKYPLEHLTLKVDEQHWVDKIKITNFKKNQLQRLYEEDYDVDLYRGGWNGQQTLIKKAIEKYNVVESYDGITYNPNIQKMTSYFQKNYKKLNLDLDKVMEGIERRNKDRDSENSTEWWQNYKSTRGSPLCDKEDVYEAYKFYNVLETLYPYTWSCMRISWSRFPETGYTTEELNNLEHCGYCWFCLERWFAFGKL